MEYHVALSQAACLHYYARKKRLKAEIGGSLNLAIRTSTRTTIAPLKDLQKRSTLQN